jgi:hypothetical protein
MGEFSSEHSFIVDNRDFDRSFFDFLIEFVQDIEDIAINAAMI